MSQKSHIDSILQTLPEGFVQSVTIGRHWTVAVVEVEDSLRAGLSISFWHREEPASSERFQSKLALELANLIYQSDTVEAGVGGAVINALLPLPANWQEVNAERVIARYGAGKRVAMVGHFPFVPYLKNKVGQLDVLEKRPRPGDLPADAAPDVIPRADVVAVTGTTLMNGTFMEIVPLCRENAKLIVLGPSTMLSPVLFDYGVDILCGSVVENIPAVAQAVRQANRYSAVHNAGVRLVAIEKPKVDN